MPRENTVEGMTGEEAHSDSCVGRIHDSLGCSCGVARINAERVAYACRRPAGHDGDHHPNPCGHDGCTGLECLLSTGQAVTVEHPQHPVTFSVPSMRPSTVEGDGGWKEAYEAQVRRVVTALASGTATCCRDPAHGDRTLPATCVGAYENPADLQFGCEACCSHGNEDGWCVPIARPATAAPVEGDGARGNVHKENDR